MKKTLTSIFGRRGGYSIGAALNPQTPLRARADKAAASVSIVRVMRTYGVDLVEAGSGTWKALCPFHTEQTPSFHVDADNGVFHCFGCGADGDVFTFIGRQAGVCFTAAIDIVESVATVSGGLSKSHED